METERNHLMAGLSIGSDGSARYGVEKAFQKAKTVLPYLLHMRGPMSPLQRNRSLDLLIAA